MSEQHPDAAPDLVLGADEIVNYPLRKATRGYQVQEVDDLLDQLAVQTQDLLDRLARAEAERDRLQHELAEASETESMLKRTLVTAQRAAEASVAEARQEADELRRQARERAEQLLAEAAEQAHELREAALRRARADEADIRRHRRDVEEHIESLRTFAQDHRARLVHHLRLQQDRLTQMELPPPPPQPERVADEVLDDDVEVVDVEELLADLAGTGAGEAAGAPSPPTNPSPSSPADEAHGEEAPRDGTPGDERGQRPDDGGPVDSTESLFDG